MDEGWIKLHHKFLEWEWHGDPNMVALFIHMLLSANEDTTHWRGNAIPRGSFVTTRAKLSYETGISVRTIRTCMDRLISCNEIAVKTTNQYSVITLVNFEDYDRMD